VSLEAVYSEAVYTADLAAGPHRIRVGVIDPVLDRLMREHGVLGAARLSAANPGSKAERPPEVNAAANARLAADLDRFRLRRLPCRSAGPKGEWPEDGFLALGLTAAQAELLARLYGQAGFLWIEPGRPVALVMP